MIEIGQTEIIDGTLWTITKIRKNRYMLQCGTFTEWRAYENINTRTR